MFRSGKLAGLFPSRAGTFGRGRAPRIREGLLETVRTETRGKIVTEWVRATPKAVGFVHDHDSPKSVLRELKEVLDATRAGVPAWMAEAKQELALLSTQFEVRGARDHDAAGRPGRARRVRAAAGRSRLPDSGRAGERRWCRGRWTRSSTSIERTVTGATGDCPLPELFHAVRAKYADLTLPSFHDGLRRLNDVRAVRLSESDEMSEPEYAMLVGDRLVYRVWR